MIPLHRKALACAAALVLATFTAAAVEQPARADVALDYNKKLASGINLGNALEAPKEGDWGVVLQPEYFPLIKAAGFSHVRVPVSWSTHSALTAPYTIDPSFFERIDWVIKQSRSNGLKVVLNMHHYEEFEADPMAHSERFVRMWQQIAEHFRSANNDLSFEFYNEPAKNIDAAKWNAIFAQTLKIVRASNPHRFIVVGPVNWNSIDQLDTLDLPDDKHLIVTVHYYSPQQFTHQGASWMGAESRKWLGTKWTGSAPEISQMTADFDKAGQWGELHHRPMYLGEFGAYEKADMDSRVLWTKAVRAQAKQHNFSDAYWEFCSGFGAYDPVSKHWREPLLDALKVSAK